MSHRVRYDEVRDHAPWWKLLLALPFAYLGFDRVVRWAITYPVRD
jgi:hypothetical protein